MTGTSRKRTVAGYCCRPAKRDAEAARLQAEMAKAVGEQKLSGRQIWNALRLSPLVGADLNFEREIVPERNGPS